MKRVLIINRGEIAIRIAKALRELEMVSVGVWTDNEPNASHLCYCDEWVRLPGSNNTDTYLNQDKIISLAKELNIDGIHPGYGFLAENSGFSKKLKDAGIIFIGPHLKAIEIMGDKAKSKTLAKEAGVPVVPGSTGEVETIEEANQIANDIGFPVLLKAVAGGGGKGMRVCQNSQEIEQFFPRVKSESLSSFGYDGLLVEKFIQNPHHIEVQILADKKGNIFHCFERECSVQRRHQKIIEEAPSPFIGTDEKLRASICDAAVKLSKAVDYDSAGTVEFIMGEDKHFYFLEMNTRIQVEHPITEEITGVDLMVNMIKSAFEIPLDIEFQGEIKITGHSIECRICSEDPVSMLPAPGKVTGLDWVFPQGIRFDHCLYTGLEVTPDFDPMVAKLVSKGFNRNAAINKMKAALNNLKIQGLKNNIALHKVILNEENFIGGHYSTHYIDEIKPQNKIKENEESLLEGVLGRQF